MQGTEERAVPRDSQVPQDLGDSKAFKVFREWKVLLDRRVSRDCKDPVST